MITKTFLHLSFSVSRMFVNSSGVAMGEGFPQDSEGKIDHTDALIYIDPSDGNDLCEAGARRKRSAGKSIAYKFISIKNHVMSAKTAPDEILC